MSAARTLSKPSKKVPQEDNDDIDEESYGRMLLALGVLGKEFTCQVYVLEYCNALVHLLLPNGAVFTLK